MANLVDMDTENYSKMTRTAGDFTLTNRESWRLAKVYREMGATTGMDTELLTDSSLDSGFTHRTYHQQPRSVQETSIGASVDINGLKTKNVSYMNQSGQWALRGRRAM